MFSLKLYAYTYYLLNMTHLTYQTYLNLFFLLINKVLQNCHLEKIQISQDKV